MNLYLDMNRIEWEILRRDGAKYLCRWCNQAYSLFCPNPACQAFGNRPALPRTHTLPKELIDGVKAERRAKRQAEDAAIQAQHDMLWERAVKAVREYKAEHPKRKTVTVEVPMIHRGVSYSYLGRSSDPFYDSNLQAALYIGWQVARVELETGSWKETRSEAVIKIKEDAS